MITAAYALLLILVGIVLFLLTYTVAVTAAKLLSRRPRYRRPPRQ